MRKSAGALKDALIEAMIDARSSLLAIVSTLPVEQLDAPCIGTWCAKDLLAHLVGWDITNLQAVREILAGQRPGFLRHYDKDWQTYNAQLVATYRIEPFKALLAEVHDSHSQLVMFLRSLPTQVIVKGKSPSGQGRTVTIRNLLAAEADDERKHAAQLEAFLMKAHP